MEQIKRYDNYPLRIVTLSNLVSILIYVSGFIIMVRLGLIFSISYVVFILALEYRLLSSHCINCYYWGKTCGFGKGRLSSLLFKKGDNSKFCSKEFSWKEMIPDLLVSLLPVVVGIVLLIIKFDFVIVSAAGLIIALSTFGNAYIRGRLTCRHCLQGEQGCPADKLFNKEK